MSDERETTSSFNIVYSILNSLHLSAVHCLKAERKHGTKDGVRGWPRLHIRVEQIFYILQLNSDLVLRALTVQYCKFQLKLTERMS